MNFPQIDTDINNSEPGKRNAGFSMPADTPFGNFFVKQVKIINRVERINLTIPLVFQSHAKLVAEGVVPLIQSTGHFFLIEEVVYHLRKVADELISIFDSLSYFERNGKYGSKLKIDCVGEVLKKKIKFESVPFKGHFEVLNNLNEISNAYKHSFIHTNINLLRKSEPMVYALSLHYNNLCNDEVFHEISFSSLINEFDLFYHDMTVWLKEFPKRVHQAKSQS